MNKRDRIDYILSLIKEQTEEFLDAEELMGMSLSAEEIVVAAVEVVTRQEVTQVTYGMPVARVDTENVAFSIGDDMEIDIIGNVEVADDSD